MGFDGLYDRALIDPALIGYLITAKTGLSEIVQDSSCKNVITAQRL